MGLCASSEDASPKHTPKEEKQAAARIRRTSLTSSTAFEDVEFPATVAVLASKGHHLKGSPFETFDRFQELSHVLNGGWFRHSVVDSAVSPRDIPESASHHAWSRW